MPQFTPWKSVNSQREIADLPGSVLSYKYSLFLYVAFNSEALVQAGALLAFTGGVVLPMIGLSSQTKIQEWIFQVTRGENETVVFEEKIHLEYNFVALEVGGIGGTGLTLFTWAINDNKTTAEVTIPSPPPDIMASPTGISIPGGGSDSTSNYSTVLVDFWAPIRKFRLRKGDRVKIPFHNAGGQYVTKYANIQTRTFKSGDAITTLQDPRTGETWTFIAEAESLICSRTRRTERFKLADDDGLVLNQSVDFVQATISGPGLSCVASANGLRLIYSPDVGLNWEEVGVVQYVEAFAAVDAEDGGFIVLGKATAFEVDSSKPEEEQINQGDQLVVTMTRNADGSICYIKRKLKGIELPTEDILGLERDGGTLTLLVKAEDDARWFESTDIVTWSEKVPS
jgi:hypothetical protein